MEFPERVYTQKEVKTAREMVNNGYKHNLTVEGSPNFEKKVNETLELIKTAGYYEFFRTYIRKIMEIDSTPRNRSRYMGKQVCG